MTLKPFERILVTGAAGALGKHVRAGLRDDCTHLRVSDIAEMADNADQAERIVCDLANKTDTIALCAGVNAIVHLGGLSTEHSFEQIIEANIRGTYHIYEGARIHGVKRVVFASSNHAIGFHEQGKTIDVDCERRPDTYYGLSKSFGEDVARFYYYRYGIETVCLRIGSSFPKPLDRRQMFTYLSYADMVRLTHSALTASNVGCSVIYGMSANKEVWWDNSKAAHIGYEPKDSSEPYRAEVMRDHPELAPVDPAKMFQGGIFVKMGPFE